MNRIADSVDGHQPVSQAVGMPPADTFGQQDSNLKELDLQGPLAELLSA